VTVRVMATDEQVVLARAVERLLHAPVHAGSPPSGARQST
jgi:hypothetical protein